MISHKMLNSEVKTEKIKLSDIDRKILELNKNAVILKFEKEESVK